MTKLCFFDVETTRTDPRLNGIIQIAGMTCTLNDGKLEEGESFNLRVRPHLADTIEDAALEVNGVTREMLAGEEYRDPKEVHRWLEKIFGRHVDKFDRADKFFFVGYNARFDYDFLRAFFEKCGDKYFGSFFHFPPVDVMNMAVVHLLGQR